MTQSWTPIIDEAANPFVDEAVPQMLLRLNTLRSNWSGAAAPTTPVFGQIFVDSDDSRIWICTNATGPVWTEIPRGALIAAIAGVGSDGLIARTASGAAASRSIAAATGLSVTNADAVAGNPTLALAVSALTEDATPDPASDFFLSYDASAAAHKKVKPASLVASQADHEAASVTDRFTTPGRQKYHPGVAKAWMNLNGTGTIAIRSSYNVSSVVDNGVGDYTANFSTAFSDANYAAIAGGCQTVSGAGVGDVRSYQTTSQATGSVRVMSCDNNSDTLFDSALVNLQAHGDQ